MFDGPWLHLATTYVLPAVIDADCTAIHWSSMILFLVFPQQLILIIYYHYEEAVFFRRSGLS